MSVRLDRRQFVVGGALSVPLMPARAMASRAEAPVQARDAGTGPASTLIFVRPELLGSREPGAIAVHPGERIHVIRQDWLELWHEQALPHLLAGGRIAGLTSHADYQVMTHLVGTLHGIALHGAFASGRTGVESAEAVAASVESARCCDGLRRRLDPLAQTPEAFDATTVWAFAR